MYRVVPATLTLSTAADTLVLRPAVATGNDPIVCSQWDISAPEIRSAAVDRPGADGTIDRSAYTGARTVTFDLKILGDVHNSAYAYVDRLAAMTHPAQRPTLTATRNTPEAAGQTWKMALRGNPFSLSYGRKAAGYIELQLSFTATLGYFEGDEQGYISTYLNLDPSTGFIFPTVFPLEPGTASAAVPLLAKRVGGSAPIHPVVYIYGPCTNPALETDDGEEFKFTGLTIPAGSFVQIDMAGGTVRLNGSPAGSVFEKVDWSVSTFWRWNPGLHSTRYTANGGNFALYWRDRRYTI